MLYAVITTTEHLAPGPVPVPPSASCLGGTGGRLGAGSCPSPRPAAPTTAWDWPGMCSGLGPGWSWPRGAHAPSGPVRTPWPGPACRWRSCRAARPTWPPVGSAAPRLHAALAAGFAGRDRLIDLAGADSAFCSRPWPGSGLTPLWWAAPLTCSNGASARWPMLLGGRPRRPGLLAACSTVPWTWRPAAGPAGQVREVVGNVGLLPGGFSAVAGRRPERRAARRRGPRPRRAGGRGPGRPGGGHLKRWRSPRTWHQKSGPVVKIEADGLNGRGRWTGGGIIAPGRSAHGHAVAGRAGWSGCLAGELRDRPVREMAGGMVEGRRPWPRRWMTRGSRWWCRRCPATPRACRRAVRSSIAAWRSSA